MDLREHQTIKGQLTISLHEDGREISRHTVHNLITSNGRQLLANLLKGTGSATLPTAWSVLVGTSSTAAAVTDTQLGNQVASSTVQAADLTVAAGSGGSWVITASATFDKLPNGSQDQILQEAGISITNSSGSTLFNHVTFSPITRTTSVQMILTWQITV